ncbi:MAG TPA: hypothetical protein VK034_18425 [Enhygromyxa sp.]|nr:hypothetical protein [Enhygromyxa sp.]
MARWSETRGYTLILTHARGPDRYARVALVRKRTLFGPAFNVREARAEDASRSGREPEALGLGRMLSWRWLGEREAQELLAARLRTLEALGYAVLDQPASEHRGPWDWLRELVHRQLHKPAAGETSDVFEPQDPHGAAASLREALAQLGLEPEAVLEGIASILEIDPEQLAEPSEATIRKLEPELLALLLPVWLEHESEQLREIGRCWLALHSTIYEIDVAVLERWLGGEGQLAAAIAPRLEREGLALLGPEGLARLAHKAGDRRIKNIAESWRERLRPPVRAPG